jgi:vacuolar-type H+-ATPase subunit D/Vma8
VDIGKGVDELGEIARQARDEVKLQNKMLDTLKTKVDDVHEHVININVRLKEVLDEVSSSEPDHRYGA